jgi:hypothetical protein
MEGRLFVGVAVCLLVVGGCARSQGYTHPSSFAWPGPSGYPDDLQRFAWPGPSGYPEDPQRVGPVRQELAARQKGTSGVAGGQSHGHGQAPVALSGDGDSLERPRSVPSAKH